MVFKVIKIDKRQVESIDGYGQIIPPNTQFIVGNFL